MDSNNTVSQSNLELKFDFLQAAIADSQEIIRFIEAKAGIAIVIIGGLLALGFANFTEYCQHYSEFPWYLCWLLWGCILFISLSIQSLVKVIMPIKITFCSNISPRFYLTGRCNTLIKLKPTRFKIEPDINVYQSEINNATHSQLIRSLSCELYAVSYIREVKTLRLNKLLIVLLITVILFVLSYASLHIKYLVF